MTATEKPWSIKKLAIVLYPFAAGAVAVNLFMLSLIGIAVGLPAISPVNAVIASIPLGVPATWLAAKWVRSMMDEADGRKPPSK